MVNFEILIGRESVPPINAIEHQRYIAFIKSLFADTLYLPLWSYFKTTITKKP